MAKQRKIIHIDMDCFYAAIEIRDDPSLKGKPIAVGGASNSRGVLCTCNYEARKYGIHSAMASSQAVRLCPDLIIVPVNFEKYRASSKVIHEILGHYSDTIEPLSLDEAYLDVTHSDLHAGSATLIAQTIRNEIFEKENLIASAGISFNKLLAKLASDWNKPNGQFVITPDMIKNFMPILPVKKLFGVGKVTAEKLKEKGIVTCGDIQKHSITEMVRLFGNYGKHLHLMAHGIDERAVCTEHIRKSLSVEETFSSDISPTHVPPYIFDDMFNELNKRLKKLKNLDKTDIKTLSVKIKFADFTSTTIQSSQTAFVIASFIHLFDTRIKNHADSTNVKDIKKIRLIGFGVSFKTEHTETNKAYQQLSLAFKS